MAKRPIPRTPLYSTARSVAYRSIPAPDSSPPTPTERIVNGSFADGSSWTTIRGIIVGGSPGNFASNGLGTSASCIQTLGATIPSGTSVTCSVNITAHLSSSTIRFVVNPGTVTLATANSGVTGLLQATVVLAADATEVRIISTNNSGVDSWTQVSLLA